MQVFCLHLNSKSYPIIVPDVFPLGFWSGSIAIRNTSYHVQDWSVPTPLRHENHAKKTRSNENRRPIWKLVRSDSDPVWWKHSIIFVTINIIWFKLIHLLFFFQIFKNVSYYFWMITWVAYRKKPVLFGQCLPIKHRRFLCPSDMK